MNLKKEFFSYIWDRMEHCLSILKNLRRWNIKEERKDERWNITFVHKMINNIWQNCKRRICNKILRRRNQIGPLHSMKHISQTNRTKNQNVENILGHSTQLDCSNMEWDDPLLSNCRSIMMKCELTMAILKKAFPSHTYYQVLDSLHIYTRMSLALFIMSTPIYVSCFYNFTKNFPKATREHDSYLLLS
jgi:hypothetical protein